MIDSTHLSPFSFKEYEEILLKFSSICLDFEEAINAEKFCILRHDVEFDDQRAHEIAKIDSSKNFKSSFLFQVNSNAYNIASVENKKLINEINEMGSSVGLHLYISHLKENDWDSFRIELEQQLDILQMSFDFKVNRFSIHRPPKWTLLNRKDIVLGLINMYGESFFEFSDQPKKIKYIADSRHSFDYGHPLDFYSFNKFQLLLHPDEWSLSGLDAEDNFRKLISDNKSRFDETLNNETKNYAEYREKINSKN
jgi:hypothetical protein